MRYIYSIYGRSAGEESACNAGNPGSIPGSGRSHRGGHGHPLQYSCLDSGIEPVSLVSPALQTDSLPLFHLRSPHTTLDLS